MSPLPPVNIGLLGLGTVGGGVTHVLARNAKEISRRAGREIVITHAAARNLDTTTANTTGMKLTGEALEVVDDPEVAVIVELMGGYEPARGLVLRALANGKHVVTANKALIAKHGNEIFAAARASGMMVGFEAAVAGGIPIIKAIREGLAGNQLEWVAGIINGTANFILTEMRDKGRDFPEVLAEAQALGYAEADPSFDVDGIDAAHKLAILASIAFGIPLQFDRVYIEGIRRITREDVAYAEKFGYRIKHLGIARRDARGVQLRVHPTLIPHRQLLASVNGVMNAVLVKGDAVGQSLYYGAGAGAEPTASAVVADLVDVVRTLTTDPENRVPHLAFQPDALSDLPVLPVAEVETAYYLRLQALDRPGVLADVTRILADRDISIEAILQMEPAVGASDVPIILLTHRVREQRMNEAIAAIQPDALFVDINAWGASAAAEASGQPWAAFAPYFLPIPGPGIPPWGLGLAPATGPEVEPRDQFLWAFVAGLLDQVRASLNAIRQEAGARPFAQVIEYATAAPRLLYYTAEPFEYPRPWPANVRLVGPGIWEPDSETIPDLTPGGRPLVLATCSTEFQNDRALAECTLAGLADEPVSVVVTTAASDPAGLTVPANARVARFLPHGALLPSATCVVCHGGMGITQKALAAGVPLCVVPFGRDQYEVARHVAVAGAGVCLPAPELTPERLRQAVREALELRPGARRIAAAFQATGGAEAAADAFEEGMRRPRP